MHDAATQTPDTDWRAIVSHYQRSHVGRALAQMATTLIPLAIVFYLMFRSLVLPYGATLLLALPAAGLLVRTFIIMHDCAHGSFLPSRRANSLIGWITGVLTLTPFGQWRRDHIEPGWHQGRLRDPGRRPVLRRLRLDHGSQRLLLQVPQLRVDFRLQLSPTPHRPDREGPVPPQGPLIYLVDRLTSKLSRLEVTPWR